MDPSAIAAWAGGIGAAVGAVVLVFDRVSEAWHNHSKRRLELAGGLPPVPAAPSPALQPTATLDSPHPQVAVAPPGVGPALAPAAAPDAPAKPASRWLNWLFGLLPAVFAFIGLVVEDGDETEIGVAFFALLLVVVFFFFCHRLFIRRLSSRIGQGLLSLVTGIVLFLLSMFLIFVVIDV